MHTVVKRGVLIVAVPTFLLAACGDNEQPGVADGIFADLGEPVPYASQKQVALFHRGRAVALQRHAPADGLGPTFNVTFCAACHEKPVFGGAGGRYRNFLLVGQKLSDGSFSGTGVNGVQSQYSVAGPGRVATDEDTNVTATRNPIPFFGAGLLAEIPDEEILSRTDPDDADGDGISGRANFDRGFVGRFGRKSQTVSLESFIRGPLFNHLGITTNPLSIERRAELPVPGAILPEAQAAAPTRRTGGPKIGSIVLPQVGAPDEPTVDNDGVPDPEMSEDDLFNVIAFTQLMAAPRPELPTEQSLAGLATFRDLGCNKCHVEELRSHRGIIPAYTDLLVHDMGPELADGIPQGEATGSEFRTAPLWGIVAVAPYLHDGRADTLDEAIRLHGGEGEASRDAYKALSETDRGNVIAFLESLGGRDQRTDGLLAPDAPIPDVGAFGGPEVALTADAQARFLRGRAVFDRDITLSAGLGPRFNGDSCRACHFEPVIGGSGPSGVDVTRHGIVNPDTLEFSEPNIGTMAHHQVSAVGERAPIDPAANVIERRQTPPVFGLGAIDRIPEATILALADPNDGDADGISGRAHVLGDGRVGRLGWKANVPSLAEFTRDGLFNEVGVSLPDQAGLTFGGATDSDDAPDPEISVESVEDLTFYMASLAPPPRTRTRPDVEDEGEQVFTAIGCNKCHVPVLQDSTGADVPLYSDLLLHDVAPTYFVGIEAGDATMREFRTSPLWGIAMTGPYMHDGSAGTIEEAILAHAGEAYDVRDAYLDLPPSMQDALLAFLRSL